MNRVLNDCTTEISVIADILNLLEEIATVRPEACDVSVPNDAALRGLLWLLKTRLEAIATRLDEIN